MSTPNSVFPIRMKGDKFYAFIVANGYKFDPVSYGTFILFRSPDKTRGISLSWSKGIAGFHVDSVFGLDPKVPLDKVAHTGYHMGTEMEALRDHLQQVTYKDLPGFPAGTPVSVILGLPVPEVV